MRSIGVDVGGTNVKLAILDGETVVETDQQATRSREGPDSLVARVGELVKAARPAGAVGIAVPGLVDADGAVVLAPNLEGEWTGFPLRRRLEDDLGTRVEVLNDGHAFALGEWSFGAGRGATNVMCVVCGTGIGGGLVLDGKLFTGVRDRAGEFGHQTMAEGGEECPCGNRGCLELYAGANAIARAGGRATFRQVVDAARHGDAAASSALATAGRLIGRAIANVLIFLCPDRVVVGGGVAAAGAPFLDPLREEVERRARVAPLDLITIVPGRLGAFAGAVGAALYARP